MFEVLFIPLDTTITGGEILNFILDSTYFKWALLGFIVVLAATIINGVIDLAIEVAQYGIALLVIAGILEFVAPSLLASILDMVPV
jgi:hypothetical protein